MPARNVARRTRRAKPRAAAPLLAVDRRKRIQLVLSHERGRRRHTPLFEETGRPTAQLFAPVDPLRDHAAMLVAERDTADIAATARATVIRRRKIAVPGVPQPLRDRQRLLLDKRTALLHSRTVAAALRRTSAAWHGEQIGLASGLWPHLSTGRKWAMCRGFRIYLPSY
jgi:hypothetical protein